jgi:hypothetical protein
VNNAAINVYMKVSVLLADFDSFGYILRNGIAGSYSSSIFGFFQELSNGFP